MVKKFHAKKHMRMAPISASFECFPLTCVYSSVVALFLPYFHVFVSIFDLQCPEKGNVAKQSSKSISVHKSDTMAQDKSGVGPNVFKN